METHQSPGYGCPVLGALKNFLKGMETYEIGEKCVDEGPSKTSLKGWKLHPIVRNP